MKKQLIASAILTACLALLVSGAQADNRFSTATKASAALMAANQMAKV